MEVLKLVEKRGRNPENIQTMGNVSDDTKMDYGIYKYAKRRKLFHWQNIILDINREIQQLKQGRTCKY
jgi:hypothetical protein